MLEVVIDVSEGFNFLPFLGHAFKQAIINVFIYIFLTRLSVNSLPVMIDVLCLYRNVIFFPFLAVRVDIMISMFITFTRLLFPSLSWQFVYFRLFSFIHLRPRACFHGAMVFA